MPSIQRMVLQVMVPRSAQWLDYLGVFSNDGAGRDSIIGVQGGLVPQHVHT